MRRRLDGRWVWAGGGLALLVLVAPWEGLSLRHPVVDPEAEARRADALAGLAEVVEPLGPDLVRLGGRRFHIEPRSWKPDDPSLRLTSFPWLSRALREDPTWDVTTNGIDWFVPITIKATNAVFDPPRFGPPAQGERWSQATGAVLGVRVPGHDAWVEPDDPNSFLLVPTGGDPSYRALCHWSPDDPDGIVFEWGRCFVRVAYPGEPRLLVEWLYWFGSSEELGRAPLAALSREALALARCLDVTDDPGRDVAACALAIVAEGEGATDFTFPSAPPVPPAAP